MPSAELNGEIHSLHHRAYFLRKEYKGGPIAKISKHQKAKK